jgi:hypothetical protein
MENADLEQLFNKFGSDKAEYAPAYRAFLDRNRLLVRTVLEIGIGTLIPDAPYSMVGWGAPWYRPGGSLRAWRSYFPNAEVHGIDVQPDTQFSEDRITTHLCDSTDAEAVRALGFVAETFDLIVDDGCHRAEQQLRTIENLFPLLKIGALYVIEDVLPEGVSARAEHYDRLSGVVGAFSPILFSGNESNPVFIVKAPYGVAEQHPWLPAPSRFQIERPHSITSVLRRLSGVAKSSLHR